jgi:anaerobic ribonucleoside-triphosphate reductase activating protein
MILGGYQKLTLIDYPGKLATTVFTVGCSFRCPFCHNPELVDLKLFHEEKSERDFLAFLKKRKGKLEAVCITGGEPTIQPDIVDFIRKIKKLGLAVKLDTNGTRPDVLKKILDAKIVDYVAMDVKAGLKARIGSLRLGSKGLMLDTPHGVPFGQILSQPTVLELERMGNDDEKAFLIGLILTHLGVIEITVSAAFEILGRSLIR